jgi:pimeloyl-ACP methyl ester carboxylesterase
MSQLTAPSQSNLVAPNQSIEAANGVTFAYRRFGNTDSATLPLVCFQHYRGNLDNWDPALVDAIAEQREVILFDNAGVGGSSGTVPRTITPMAYDALAFIEALGLEQIDILGYSMGGFVAQEVTLIRPRLVRRLVLAGTAPQGGVEQHGYRDEVYGNATADEPGAEDLLALFFERSDTSVAKGWEFVERIFTRSEDRDIGTSLATRDAQLDAVTTWGIPDVSRLNRLAGITQPVLAVNGENDRMVPTPNTFLLAEHLPNVQLKIYPDAGHGFLFQYPMEFAAELEEFFA